MLKPPHSRLQPSYYGAFRCVGADCEDTCCSGWRVPVDKRTFEQYQACTQPDLSAKLKTFVIRNPNAESAASYAEIRLQQGVCPFLSQGWCEIHSALGANMLSNNCATYPRSSTRVDGTAERALHLSCPEAARLALTDSRPMEFVPFESHELTAIEGLADAADTDNAADTRRRAITLLQNRSAPLVERLRQVGGSVGCHTATGAMPSATRFELIAELILARIGSDATNRRFLDCYQAFMRGLNWNEHSTLEALGASLNAALDGPYAKFTATYGHMMEHYLVNYVFRTVFPSGTVSVNRKLREHGFAVSAEAHYHLLIVQFVLLEALLAGVAASQTESLGVSAALKIFQAFSKTFEQSVAFPGKAMQLLAQRNVTAPALLR